jgi:hypothetical protein
LETLGTKYNAANMADENIVFSETNVGGPGVSVTNSQQATPAQLVALAKTIWEKVKRSGVAAEDDSGNDALLASLQEEFKDFNISFPLILRWMVQMRKFNARALEKYLMKHSTTKMDTREAFLRLQAEYLVLLYREEHRHPDENFIKRYRQSLVEQLVEEDSTFTTMQKQVEVDLAAQEQVVDADRRMRLYKFLLAQKVGREVAKPLSEN